MLYLANRSSLLILLSTNGALVGSIGMSLILVSIFLGGKWVMGFTYIDDRARLHRTREHRSG